MAFLLPRDAEGEDAVGFDDPLDDLRLFELRVLVVHLFDRLEDLAHGLQVFAFAGMFALEVCHDFVQIHSCIRFGWLEFVYLLQI
jgi:hypothetical protein